MKSILIIGNANTYFRIDYTKNIRSKDVKVDILSLVKCKDENRKYYDNVIDCELKKSGIVGTVKAIYNFFRTVRHIRKYDAIHIHSVKAIESVFASTLKMKCDVLVCTIYGSDIYRASSLRRFVLRRLFAKTDYITIATNQIMTDFVGFFGDKFSKKIKVIPFGFTQLNNIKAAKLNAKSIKEELDIPIDKMVVTIGYNATKEQHHLDVLNEIRRSDLLKDAFYIFPLTYGNEDYKKLVLEEFQKSGINGKCFTEFMPIEDVCKLRVISDIMIQIQDTDAFSSSMNEYLYAGNVIITGAWLPYNAIKRYIYTIDKVDDVAIMLTNILGDYEKYKDRIKGADQFLDRNYSWDELRPKWLALYDAKRGTSNV